MMAVMSTGPGDVAFDFDGSLQLARTLYDLSTWLEGALEERIGAADEASRAWRGPLGDEFRLQTATDDDEARRLASSLHVAAVDWAQAWADAMTEQNRRNRERRITELASERNWAERAVDLVTADDPADHVAPADRVQPPHSPHYIPTAELQRF